MAIPTTISAERAARLPPRNGRFENAQSQKPTRPAMPSAGHRANAGPRENWLAVATAAKTAKGATLIVTMAPRQMAMIFRWRPGPFAG